MRRDYQVRLRASESILSFISTCRVQRLQQPPERVFKLGGAGFPCLPPRNGDTPLPGLEIMLRRCRHKLVGEFSGTVRNVDHTAKHFNFWQPGTNHRQSVAEVLIELDWIGGEHDVVSQKRDQAHVEVRQMRAQFGVGQLSQELHVMQLPQLFNAIILDPAY